MPHAQAGLASSHFSLPRFALKSFALLHASEQQLRDVKQKAAPPPKNLEQSDHEDILEGLEREYGAAMAKLQAAHEREMLLSTRVGDLQKKLQVCAFAQRLLWCEQL